MKFKKGSVSLLKRLFDGTMDIDSFLGAITGIAGAAIICTAGGIIGGLLISSSLGAIASLCHTMAQPLLSPATRKF